MGDAIGELAALGAVDAVRAMRAGELRAEDYARALIEREPLWRHLNAFLAFEPDRVIEAARAADKARASGAATGILHGLPIPVKDSVNTRSLATTNGTKALANFRPREDADVVKRLFAAGAILMGKTNLQEMSRGWTNNNLAFGAVKNARDPSRIPGGSSGGSATLVAAGVAPMAVAEDTWGSIRVPAAFCGVAGFRPTHGRYPNGGIMPLTADRFDQVGPVARSVADVALFDACASGDAQPIAPAPLRGVRLGVPPEMLEGMDPEAETIVEDALRRLEAAGAVLVRASLPPQAANAQAIAGAIITAENIAAIKAFLIEHDAGITFDELFAQLSANIRERYDGPALTPKDHEQALAERDRLMAALAKHYETQRIAALVFPPCIAPAPPLGENVEVMVRGVALTMRGVVGRNTAIGPCGRLSSLVLPAGLTAGGLPVALEFDGPAGADRDLLALGYSLEKVLPVLGIAR